MEKKEVVEEYFEPLPLEINGGRDIKGYYLTQVKRCETHAIYAQRVGNKDGRILSYDVIKIKKQKACIVSFGGVPQQLKAKEQYPSSREWGLNAQSFPTLTMAEAFYNSLTL